MEELGIEIVDNEIERLFMRITYLNKDYQIFQKIEKMRFIII